jgi:protein-disulfide isomerase
VDVPRAKKDMEDPKVAAVVALDLADAAALGVTKTPGFFVNGRPLEPFGAQPLADLIRSELISNYPD